MTKKEYSIVNFVKLSKNEHDYPIASSDVYTPSSNNKIEQVKATTIDDNVLILNYFNKIISI